MNGVEAKATDSDVRDAIPRDCLQETAEELLIVNDPSYCSHSFSDLDSVSLARAHAAISVV